MEMTPWLDSLARHGPSLLFGICLVEALGLPIPAAVALLTAGALVAIGKLTLLQALLASGAGLLFGDLVYFVLGRKTGWWLLGLLCRLSLNPESCILSSAEAFYRRGRLVLVFAKFVPGLNTMAPPLAGSMQMAFLEFLALDLAGILLYTGTYIGAGFAFRDLLAVLLDTMGRAGNVIEGVLFAALLAYVACRLWLVWKHRIDSNIPRADIHDVDGPVFDVRSHGYYDAGAQRIQGSIRLEPNRLAQTLSGLPEAGTIYLYCT
jgi:membrane protein DedA with SNARE-associated domain